MMIHELCKNSGPQQILTEGVGVWGLPLRAASTAPQCGGAARNAAYVSYWVHTIAEVY
jgi:hypothetical protein